MSWELALVFIVLLLLELAAGRVRCRRRREDGGANGA